MLIFCNAENKMMEQISDPYAHEQNYMYAKGATEMGRGERSNPFGTSKTPGPGAHDYRNLTNNDIRKRFESMKSDSQVEENVKVKHRVKISIPRSPKPKH